MNTGHATRRIAAALAVGAACLLGGCATSGNPRDPMESFNRAVFDINDGLDKALIKPVAQGYEAALPAPVRKGVTNFFGNIEDVFIAANNLLQGKPGEAAIDVSRFAINSTLGVLGVMDVATDLGLEKHDEDFGQTLGRWGVGDGAYLVLPILGPSTVRDAFGRAIDMTVDPVSELNDVSARNLMTFTRALNERAGLLGADKIIEEAALDRYAYIREGYLQRRRNRIYDGEPPRERYDQDAAAGAPAVPPGRTVATVRYEPVIGSANLFVERLSDEAVSASAASTFGPSLAQVSAP